MLGLKDQTKGQTQHGTIILFFLNFRFNYFFKNQSIVFNFVILASVILYQVFQFSCSCINSLEDTLNVLFDINIAGDILKLFQILITCQLVKSCVGLSGLCS